MGYGESMMLESNTKFAMIALADTEPAFDGEVAINARWIFSTTPPFELDATWQEWLGSVAIEDIQQSDFFMIVHEPSETANVLDNQNSALLSAVDSTLIALHLLGIPGYRSGHEFTGSVGPSSVDTRQGMGLVCFKKSSRSAPHQWSRPDIETSVVLGSTVSSIRSDAVHFRQLQRGVRIYLSALEASDPRDRLHQAVRSLEALSPSEPGHRTADFRKRFGLVVLGNDAPELLNDLYELRSRVEHVEDPHAYRLGMDDELFAGFFERSEAQAVDFARSVYLRIISDADTLDFFEHDADIPEFWNAVERGDIKSLRFSVSDLNLESPME
jgi:hypothetical protein